jgi:hypothetical protein
MEETPDHLLVDRFYFSLDQVQLPQVEKHAATHVHPAGQHFGQIVPIVAVLLESSVELVHEMMM